jgi:hypothetical protein
MEIVDVFEKPVTPSVSVLDTSLYPGVRSS